MDRISDVIERNSAVLEGTRAVSPSGELLVLHHATNRAFDRFDRPSDMGFHFGSADQAARRRLIKTQRGEASEHDDWRVISCVLAVRNPLVIADDPGVWNPRWLTATFAPFLDASDRHEIRRLADALDEREKGAPFGEREEAILASWFSTLRNSLERSGHDGIVYRNVFENAGRAIEWSWVVFSDDQAVRVNGATEASAIPAGKVITGRPPALRGARPMRHHQPRGTGPLMRESDRKAFRKAVEEWAASSDVEWTHDYPLDYRPSFGEMRPSHDLRAKEGEESGFFVAVSSATGTVSFQPFSRDERSDALMKRFRSDACEGFFDHGRNGDCEVTVTWRPAETLESFSARLAAVALDVAETFPPERPSPSP